LQADFDFGEVRLAEHPGDVVIENQLINDSDFDPPTLVIVP